MLENLPTSWLIALGFALCLVLMLIYRKLAVFCAVYFKPYKKGQRYWCRVTAVSDGDTLTCARLNLRRSSTKLRFAFIDAPESSQSYGAESQKLVKKLIYRKVVRIKITDVDRYGRHVGVVHRVGKNINEELVKRGAAWVYEDYIKDPNQRKQWIALQEQAKKQKKGLWKNPKPTRPSVYRKAH